MNKRRSKFFHTSTLNRFKFMNYILLLIVLSLFLNTYITIKMVEEGRIILGGELSYITLQINFVTVILILIISFLFFLHYGFGALSRMENILRRVLEGEFTLRINLRKKDIMRPFAEKLNAVLDLLEKNVTKADYKK